MWTAIKADNQITTSEKKYLNRIKTRLILLSILFSERKGYRLDKSLKSLFACVYMTYQVQAISVIKIAFDRDMSIER
jgi:hypothetical protein